MGRLESQASEREERKMDIGLMDEMTYLRSIVDKDGSQRMEKLFVDYLIATQTGDEEIARMTKAFILAYRKGA